MSRTNNTATVTILDKEYLVACPPEAQRQLEDAARALDQKMKEIRASGKVYGTERIAVMAALNLTYDLMQQGQKTEQVSTTLSTLHEKLDAALRNK
ncbi:MULTISPECIES: cell division protein ZapA [unclassified Hahella]|uniref:cell division protein ZapA n=1 Tax=unclassified Hahella TaxID=2624107 RepID=UPI000FDEB9E5|nr:MULTISPECIES: cell division protein ZapA [unclassified Hahella]AZZ94338.1 cell division protein ZapA [Hahella sp. KA22]MBU6953167.1 cell division protein ZapA [Hahella sp. HN01]MDG9669843.1 cell division protein ZapA [Hahella sp. CR1]QAY57712.1 cell division protein ZapA [Hahella sp. KA22]